MGKWSGRGIGRGKDSQGTCERRERIAEAVERASWQERLDGRRRSQRYLDADIVVAQQIFGWAAPIKREDGRRDAAEPSQCSAEVSFTLALSRQGQRHARIGPMPAQIAKRPRP